MAYNFTKEFLEQHYVEERKGITTIAREIGCFPEQVRRALRKFGIPMRSKSQSLKHYYENGGEPALKGQTLPQEYKDSISKSMHSYWQSLPDNERERRINEFVKQSQKAWENTPQDEREMHLYVMNRARMETSRHGSRIQNDVRDLMSNDYRVMTEVGNLRGGLKLRIDIFLPKYGIAIEIDGPSHYEPLFGEDALKKSKLRDKRKNDILTNSDIKVIRVRLPHKTYRRFLALEIYNELKKLIKNRKKLKDITYLKVDV
jgi:hypothetical protein